VFTHLQAKGHAPIAGPTCADRSKAICLSLPLDQLDALTRIGRRRSLSAGQTLLWEDEESLLVANVIEGVLKLTTSTSDGREPILGIVYPSDFIGRPFGQHSRHIVTALADAQVCLFTRREFDLFARQHPEVGHELLRRTLRELDRARTFMALLGRKTAGERVASLLADMASRFSDDQGRFDLPIGRQQMADLLGLTIETISRQLSSMRAARIIEIEGRCRIAVRDPDALAAAAAI
jgi:CRP/FNR family transcriptional regulator, anaerobic regulatory protein